MVTDIFSTPSRSVSYLECWRELQNNVDGENEDEVNDDDFVHPDDSIVSDLDEVTADEEAEDDLEDDLDDVIE